MSSSPRTAEIFVQNKSAAIKKLGINEAIVDKFLQQVAEQMPVWYTLINICFLPESYKEKYAQLIENRWRMFL